MFIVGLCIVMLAIVSIIEKFFDLKVLRLRLKVAAIIVVSLTVAIPSWHDFAEKQKNEIRREKIYLALFETGKEVPLNDNYQIIRPINPIEKNMPTQLRFKLHQYNVNAPEITKIMLTFPPAVIPQSIKSLPAEGWEWYRSIDNDRIFFLNYPVNDPPAKGSYSLPSLEATFSRIGNLTFRYRITANKVEPITRTFTISTTKTESGKPNEIKNGLEDSRLKTFNATIFSSGYDKSSVTPNSVAVSAPIHLIVTGTVTPDSETKKK